MLGHEEGPGKSPEGHTQSSWWPVGGDLATAEGRRPVGTNSRTSKNKLELVPCRCCEFSSDTQGDLGMQ